ncbi:uncharacterized protein [Cardiocondyla obscurior]|uniref:uncharacterized protein isoform X1 n=1 Tax=Cardiocondyla obscurior TaxID=286306 RepID=UPI0039655A73
MSSPQDKLSLGEDRTKVIVSACESSSCHESGTTANTPDTASLSRRKCLCPSRPPTANRCTAFPRRVSFNDATVVGTNDGDDRHAANVQDDRLKSARLDTDKEIENKAERETFYDIWQADDSSTVRSEDGYLESTPRIDNYVEDRCGVSDCTFSGDKGYGLQSENIGEQTVESDERRRAWPDSNDVCSVDRFAGNKPRPGEDDTAWNSSSNCIYKNTDSSDHDEYRMRGGCGGCSCETRGNVWRSPQYYGCCCRGVVPNESCASTLDESKIRCVMPSRVCSRCPRVCKKTTRCEPPPCMTDVRSCDGGGCCGGCGPPTRICTPSSKICNLPAHSSRGKLPCAPCCPQFPCSISSCKDCCSGSNNYKKLCSSRYLPTTSGGCCGVNDRAKCNTNAACCRVRLPCECLGGGLDCRRCGRKVYQAEMQVSPILL